VTGDTVAFPEVQPLLEHESGYTPLATGSDPGRTFEVSEYVVQEVLRDVVGLQIMQRAGSVVKVVKRSPPQAFGRGHIKANLALSDASVIQLADADFQAIGYPTSRPGNSFVVARDSGRLRRGRKGSTASTAPKTKGSSGSDKRQSAISVEFEAINELHGTVVEIDEEHGVFHATLTRPGDDSKLAGDFRLELLDDDQRAALQVGSSFYYVTGFENVRRNGRRVRRTPQARFVLRKVRGLSDDEMKAAREEARWLLAAD
jgi:hypothetical protein